MPPYVVATSFAYHFANSQIFSMNLKNDKAGEVVPLRRRWEPSIPRVSEPRTLYDPAVVKTEHWISREQSTLSDKDRETSSFALCWSLIFFINVLFSMKFFHSIFEFYKIDPRLDRCKLKFYTSAVWRRKTQRSICKGPCTAWNVLVISDLLHSTAAQPAAIFPHPTSEFGWWIVFVFHDVRLFRLNK